MVDSFIIENRVQPGSKILNALRRKINLARGFDPAPPLCTLKDASKVKRFIKTIMAESSTPTKSYSTPVKRSAANAEARPSRKPQGASPAYVRTFTHVPPLS